MARISSEDTKFESAIEIKKGSSKDHDGQLWELITVTLSCGPRRLTLGESPEQKDSCLLCRTPHDEARALVNLLSELASGKRTKVLFEPAEPSFEIWLERTIEEGITVHAWLDSSNASTGFYNWDAIGIRFFTSNQHLAAFIKELIQEFALEQA